MRNVTVMAMALVCSVWALPALAADVDVAEPFLGKWDVKMEIQDRTIEAKLVLKQNDDGKLSGTWETQRGKSDLEDVKVDAKLAQLTFVRHINRQGMEMEILGKAKIKEAKLIGAMSTQMGDLPFTGIRPKVEEAVVLVGTPEAKAIVADMDMNGDGKIQESEADRRFMRYFYTLDANEDGEIDEIEMEVMVQYQSQQRNR